MYKFRFFLNFDKEEQWLEQMAKKGYHLKKATFGYQFDQGKPANTVIRTDFRKFKKKEDFIDYCTLFADSGWKHRYVSKSCGVQYFKKIDDTAENEIFSDANSKASRYKRYANMFIGLAISYVPLLIVFYLTDIIDLQAFINPKSLYYTPG